MDSPEVTFTLAYLVFAVCFVFTPNEFHSAGLTVQNLLSGWLGSEDAAFVSYHLRRTAATLLCHSLLPLGEPPARGRGLLRDPGVPSRPARPGPAAGQCGWERRPAQSGSSPEPSWWLGYRIALPCLPWWMAPGRGSLEDECGESRRGWAARSWGPYRCRVLCQARTLRSCPGQC